MKTLFAKKNLFLRVAVGFVLGVLLGFAAPKFSIATKVVGDLYLNLIKMMIIPIVFCAVFCGIANIHDSALLRKIGVQPISALFDIPMPKQALWQVLSCQRAWLQPIL